MRIAVVATGGFHPSGREQVVPLWLALFSRLARAHEIHVFVLRHLPDAQTYSLLGFDVHNLGRPSAPFGLTRLAQEQALHRALAIHGPFDLIHGLWGDPAGTLAVGMGRAFAIPSVVTFDSGEFVSLPAIDYGSQRTARGRRAIAGAAQATRAHVCTEFMATLARAHGLSPVVIPLTTVTSESARSDRTSLRPSVVRPSLRLIQIASLNRVKNQRLLIDAMTMLTSSVDVHLDLVGEDTLDGELQRYAAERGVAHLVTFHGFVAHDLLAPLRDAADFYVQTSLHEGSGVAVLEAAAAGLPIVGTRVGHLADWAGDKALAINTVSADAMAKALLSLATDRDRAVTVAARAQRWVIERDAAWAAGQVQALYLDAAARRST